MDSNNGRYYNLTNHIENAQAICEYILKVILPEGKVQEKKMFYKGLYLKPVMTNDSIFFRRNGKFLYSGIEIEMIHLRKNYNRRIAFKVDHSGSNKEYYLDIEAFKEKVKEMQERVEHHYLQHLEQEAEREQRERILHTLKDNIKLKKDDNIDFSGLDDDKFTLTISRLSETQVRVIYNIISQTES